jgi:exosortase
MPLNDHQAQRQMIRQHISFGLLLLASLLIFLDPLLRLLGLVDRSEYSHIAVVAPLSALLIYRDRQRIFSSNYSSTRPAWLTMVFATMVARLGAQSVAPSESDSLTLSVLALVLIWVAAFLTCYGPAATREALFPLAFLFLMVPLPELVMNKIMWVLRSGSASAAALFFTLAGVPVLRDGFTFTFSDLRIEVAQECSGIRSSVVLFIFSLIIGRFSLSSAWKRGLLCLAVVPIVILKNGLRIFTLSTLSLYVNRGFLAGWLHQFGGMPFFFVSLLALVVVLILLRRLPGGASSGTAKQMAKESTSDLSPLLLEQQKGG